MVDPGREDEAARVHAPVSTFRKSFSQNRQPNVIMRNSKQYVDDFVGELSFSKQLINTFCAGRQILDVKMKRLEYTLLSAPSEDGKPGGGRPYREAAPG